MGDDTKKYGGQIIFYKWESLNSRNQERQLPLKNIIVRFGDLIGQGKAQNFGHFQV